MRIAILYDPWLLSARGTLDLDGYREDSRGMTGSEQCAVRLCEELREMGHQALLYTKGREHDNWTERGVLEHDVAISINCPDGLRDVRAKFKVVYALLNDWTFCKVGFEQHVDLFASPSAPHLEQVLTNPLWRRVDTFECQEGRGRYEPDPSKWCVVPLGCDPERYEGFSKVPGRVVYCSSPDRGLHWLLQEWPHIKRAVPHAHLRIFYRLQKWIDDLKRAQDPETLEVFHSVKALWQRAVYIEEALRRMSDPKWGIEVRDSVSRATIEREMAEAECLAYPMDTTVWSEGFSVTTLEACAARACPITTNGDAFGGIYASALPLVEKAGNWQALWRNHVIRALNDAAWRDKVNDKAEALARSMTWKNTAERLLHEIQSRLERKPSPALSST